MPKKGANCGPDALIARLAANQHGVVSIAQLKAAGILPSGVTDRVAAGRLHRIHRGVYAVGHPRLGDEGRWMAAVLACGEDAVLSHRSAAALWEIRRSRASSPRSSAPPSLPVVEVTVPGDGGRRKQAGIWVHRSKTLLPVHCTRRAGIPVTNPARTLEDLHRVLPAKQFAGALREAEYLRLPIGDRFTPDRSRTELEARLLALCRRHRLPKPEVNFRVDRFVVDVLWREQRLIVEVDGWQSHGTRSAFEEDRARDARLKLLGYEVVRFTWRQIDSDPRVVAATIRALIRSRST